MNWNLLLILHLIPLTLPARQGGGEDCFRFSFPAYFFDDGGTPGATVTVANRQLNNGQPHVMSTPAACTDQSIVLSLGAPVSVDVGTHIQEQIPILFNASGTVTVEELDFELTVTDVNGHLDGVETMSVTAANGSAIINFVVEEVPSSTGYKVYGHTTMVQNFTSGTIGYLLLNRPSMDNVSIDVEIAYDFARIHELGGECCSPVVSPGPDDVPYSVEIAGQDYCGDLVLEILEEEVVGSGDCSANLPIANYLISIRNNGTQDAQFSLFELELNFVGTGDISLEMVDYDPPLCDDYCPLGCFTISGHTLNYAYCAAPGSFFTINDGDALTFRVHVYGTSSSCLTGVYFRHGRSVYEGGAPDCAPVASNLTQSQAATASQLTLAPDCAPVASNLTGIEQCASIGMISGFVGKEDQNN